MPPYPPGFDFRGGKRKSARSWASSALGRYAFRPFGAVCGRIGEPGRLHRSMRCGASKGGAGELVGEMDERDTCLRRSHFCRTNREDRATFGIWQRLLGPRLEQRKTRTSSSCGSGAPALQSASYGRSRSKNSNGPEHGAASSKTSPIPSNRSPAPGSKGLSEGKSKNTILGIEQDEAPVRLTDGHEHVRSAPPDNGLYLVLILAMRESYKGSWRAGIAFWLRHVAFPSVNGEHE